jgi:hypothetical protein
MKSFKSIRESGDLSILESFVSSLAILSEDKIVIDMPNVDREDIIDYLEENGVDYTEKDGTIYINDPVEEAEISIAEKELDEEFDIEFQLDEASAKRKIVVRKGKKRIIFKCAPGMMKRGPRVCVRRPAASLRKLKFTSRRSARKSKSKKNTAKRKRNISLRKRLTFGLRARKKKR